MMLDKSCFFFSLIFLVQQDCLCWYILFLYIVLFDRHPPNVTHVTNVWLIEKLWALLSISRKIYDNGRKTENKEKIKTKICQRFGNSMLSLMSKTTKTRRQWSTSCIIRYSYCSNMILTSNRLHSLIQIKNMNKAA